MMMPNQPTRREAVHSDAECAQPRRFADMVGIDAEVSLLDPLEADSFFSNELISFNAAADMDGLAHRAASLVPSATRIATMSYLEALAATRDLGMIAASLQRHGRGVAAVDGLEEALLRCSALTGEVPADTVYSYGPRNPRDDRIRRFTDHDSELVFIQSFRDGMQNLPSAIDLLVMAQGMSLTDRGYVHSLRTADDFLVEMVEAIVEVRRKITPQFFTGTMRPYFDPKVVGGRPYLAPGGAQMPLIVVDQLIWGIELHDPVYIQYYFENVEYQPPFVRELAMRVASQPSLVQQAASQLAGLPALPPTVASSLRALDRILAVMSKFRMPHWAVAKDNFALRSGSDLGSGGYQTDILKYLIDRIREARATVHDLQQIPTE